MKTYTENTTLKKTTAKTKAQKSRGKRNQDKTTANYIGNKSNREKHRLPESKENIENITTLKYTYREDHTEEDHRQD